ncbi:hypothetical protein [Micromonospora sp. IBHARD004]|uniref:hypothetical protein n=1 Tax=Micromonospora sp. IBHARD004 TaxID=3457764 RepID=UPI0040580FCE
MTVPEAPPRVLLLGPGQADGIWAESGRVDEPIFACLLPGARREALAGLRLYAPHLVPAGAE